LVDVPSGYERFDGALGVGLHIVQRRESSPTEPAKATRGTSARQSATRLGSHRRPRPASWEAGEGRLGRGRETPWTKGN
jgi:hypothetical protein